MAAASLNIWKDEESLAECKVSRISASSNDLQFDDAKHNDVAGERVHSHVRRIEKSCTCNGRATRNEQNGDVSRNDSFLEAVCKGIFASRPPRKKFAHCASDSWLVPCKTLLSLNAIGCQVKTSARVPGGFRRESLVGES